jgi:hypothetical protein
MVVITLSGQLSIGNEAAVHCDTIWSIYYQQGGGVGLPKRRGAVAAALPRGRLYRVALVGM